MSRSITSTLYSAITTLGLLGGCVAEASDGPPDNATIEAGALGTASILLIHGFSKDADGGFQAYDCQSFWRTTRDVLRVVGHTGRVQTVGWYSGNVNCDRNLAATTYTKNFAGDVTLEEGSASNVLSYDTSLRHIGYRLAWAIAREAGENGGKPVRVVANSLSGLALRYAVQQSSLGNPNFPSLAKLNMDDTYQLGVPNTGTLLAIFGSNRQQARQALNGSDFLTRLNATPRVGSARWWSFTSSALPNGDGVVNKDSACFSQAERCYDWKNPAYPHDAYRNDTNVELPRQGAYAVRQPKRGETTYTGSFTDVGATAVIAKELTFR
jgi:hypothetical protein